MQGQLPSGSSRRARSSTPTHAVSASRSPAFTAGRLRVNWLRAGRAVGCSIPPRFSTPPDATVRTFGAFSAFETCPCAHRAVRSSSTNTPSEAGWAKATHGLRETARHNAYHSALTPRAFITLQDSAQGAGFLSRGSGSQQGQSPSGAIAYGVLDPL